MSSFAPFRAFAAAVIGVLSWSSVAHAQATPQENARAYFDQGLRLVDAKRFGEAAVHFQRAYELQAHPLVLYNLGMAQAAAHQPSSAIKTLKEYLASNDARQNNARAREARSRVAELEATVVQLEVELDPAQAELRIDGRLQPSSGTVTLDPGSHLLRVTAENYAPQEQELLVGEGEQRSLSVRLMPIEADASRIDSYPYAFPAAPARPSHVSLLRLNPARSAPAPRSARRTSLPSKQAGVGKTSTWLLVTGAGAGLLLGATATGLIVDNNARYAAWRRDDAAISAARRALGSSDALLDRQRSNDARADRIKLQDEVATGVAVASGLVLAATVLWWWLGPDGSTRSLAPRSPHGTALVVGSFD
jgi:tetratricopeptide (TPR) repeat protein